MPNVTRPSGSEFPRTIGRVATTVLALHGYTTFEHLTQATTSELLALHGIGPKAIRILREELATRSLDFADTSGTKGR